MTKSAKDMTKDELVDEVKALAYHQRDRLKQQLTFYRRHSEIEIGKLEQEIKLLDEYLELHNDTN